MNIAFLHWGFPPIIGGVETHLTIILPELIKKGYKTALLTGIAPNTPNRCSYKGTEVFRSPLFDLNWLVKRGLDSLEDELNKNYNEFFDFIKPDIIHAHNMHYFSEVHANVLSSIAKKKGIPLVLTAHNVWDDIQFLKLTRNIEWEHIIAVSHYIKKELVGIGCSEERVTVIHHGVDTDLFSNEVDKEKVFSNHPELKDRKIVFHPARLGLAKGCDVSIKAINMVKEMIPNVILVLAGSKNIIDWSITQEKDIAYFVDLIKTFNLQKNVYINHFALEEMSDIYGVSDVCIYPSSASEPFGLTMLEALSCAKPMIVTNMGGMPEIIRNDIDGYVIKVKDHETLALRIIELLTNEKLRKRLGNTGRETVNTHYTKKIMTDCHDRFYKKILSRTIITPNL